MSLKLMYITNRPEIASIVEAAGVDRVFVDMEYIGKNLRQGGMDTVQSYHTVGDIQAVCSVVSRAEVVVRCNPIHEASDVYGSSEQEINAIIEAGADVIMLPYFKTVDEVETFIKLVAGRTKTLLLVETPEAVEVIDEILLIQGIDEIFIGLNDLSLGYHKKFMFELLAEGDVEMLCNKFRQKGIPYGFGGIASLGKGMLPAEYVIREHYRLGSTSAILSRSFCNTNIITDLEAIQKIFDSGMREIRAFEEECRIHPEFWEESRAQMAIIVKQIVERGV